MCVRLLDGEIHTKTHISYTQSHLRLDTHATMCALVNLDCLSGECNLVNVSKGGSFITETIILFFIMHTH